MFATAPKTSPDIAYVVEKNSEITLNRYLVIKFLQSGISGDMQPVWNNPHGAPGFTRCGGTHANRPFLIYELPRHDYRQRSFEKELLRGKCPH